jgi:predicted patatin/cPLA2 family phospholipase
MFTAGICDWLYEHGYGEAFSHVWGVSAGAINGADFLAGQPGRFCRDVLAYRDDDQFMSLTSLVRTGDYVGREFLYDKINNELDPFDNAHFNANPTAFTVVATDATFGTAAYLDVCRLPECLDAVVASASQPIVSRAVEYDGRLLLDGGTADSVPVEKALEAGDADRAVVVLTQDRTYVKGPSNTIVRLGNAVYRDTPLLAEAIESRPARYNAQRKRIWDLEQAGKVLVLAPVGAYVVANSEADGGKLLALYIHGRRTAEKNIDAILAFMEG